MNKEWLRKVNVHLEAPAGGCFQYVTQRMETCLYTALASGWITVIIKSFSQTAALTLFPISSQNDLQLIHPHLQTDNTEQSEKFPIPAGVK